MPVACQSRAVTEPQREKARLEFDLPPHKKPCLPRLFAKRRFEAFKMAGGIGLSKKFISNFFDKLSRQLRCLFFLASIVINLPKIRVEFTENLVYNIRCYNVSLPCR